MAVADPVLLKQQLSSVAFQHPFRRCQLLALDAFERAQSKGRSRFHFSLPPGSGKTALGLEMVRRLGRPALILCPNTAIQAQWADQWRDFQPSAVQCSTDREDLAPITVLTYQAICVLEDDEEIDRQSLSLWQASLEENGLDAEEAGEEIEQLRRSGGPHYETELSRYRQRARLLTAGGGDREDLLQLLHPQGRELIEHMKLKGPWTIVLDECHHLLEMWGYLVRVVVEELGEGTRVVGLTATPPDDLGPKQRELYRELFEQSDLEIPAPAAVRDGALAPYQDLVYLTTPLPHEIDYIDEQHSRFLRLISRLMDQDFGSLPFVRWAEERANGQRVPRKAEYEWARFERDRPAFAVALLRFLWQYKLALPEGVQLQERHRQPMTADDWVALLDEYCMRQLRSSAEAKDHAAWEEVRAALPSVGYVLTSRGIRSYVSPVDRVLSLSASKGAAVLAILAAEERTLREKLRALVLCDYEQAGSDIVAKLRGILDPQAGSAALLLRILLSDPQAAGLNPILMTGKTIACSRAAAVSLADWLMGREPKLEGALEVERLVADCENKTGWDDLVEVRGSTSWWRPRNYVPLVTEYFESGRSRCLVGTRGLLGEGWDAKRVNVMVDLTAATTSTAVHQSRGRSLRLDPEVPEKVADNWDVVCVSPRHPKGFSDYARFVRKHRRYFGVTEDGEVESGVSHVDADLSPYGAPKQEKFEAINRRQLERPEGQPEVAKRWAVGQPYRNEEVATLRVRVGKPLPAPLRRIVAAKKSRQTVDDLGRDWATIWAGAGLLASIPLVPLGASTVAWAGLPVAVLLAALPPMAALAPLLFRSATSPILARDSTGGIAAIATAVAEALFKLGIVSSGVKGLHVVPQKDGYFRCYLDKASPEESSIFAEALEEALSPLANPKGILPRYLPSGSGHFDRLTCSLKLYWRPSASSALVTWHALPRIFTLNKARSEAYRRAWNRHVSPGKILYSSGFLAQEIIQAQRGENPMEIETQGRSLWR